MDGIKEICEGLPGWAHYLVFSGLLAWEFWLGRTTKTKAGSTIELIANAFKSKPIETKEK